MKLGDSWQLNLAGSYFDSQGETVRRQSAIPTGSFAGNTAIGPGQIPAIVGALNPFRVPATYPGNTFGAPANIRAILPDRQARQNDSDAATTRLVAELSGTTAGWDVNFAAGYTNVSQKATFNGYINETALLAALNDPKNPFMLGGGNSKLKSCPKCPRASAARPPIRSISPNSRVRAT